MSETNWSRRDRSLFAVSDATDAVEAFWGSLRASGTIDPHQPVPDAVEMRFRRVALAAALDTRNAHEKALSAPPGAGGEVR
jgi:hypothetical protein